MRGVPYKGLSNFLKWIIWATKINNSCHIKYFTPAFREHGYPKWRGCELATEITVFDFFLWSCLKSWMNSKKPQTTAVINITHIIHAFCRIQTYLYFFFFVKIRWFQMFPKSFCALSTNPIFTSPMASRPLKRQLSPVCRRNTGGRETSSEASAVWHVAPSCWSQMLANPF